MTLKLIMALAILGLGLSVMAQTPAPNADFYINEDTDFSETWLTLEDLCDSQFQSAYCDCYKLTSNYEPIVKKVGNHWEITFK